MLDTVRKYVEAGRDALTPKKAEALARALAKRGEDSKEQVAKKTRELMDWSRKSSERLAGIIRAEVTKQISKAGLATKGEVESLKGRVRSLEKKQKGSSSGKRTATKRSASAKE